MKYLFFSLLAMGQAHAEEITIHSTSIYMIILLLILALIITSAFFVQKCKSKEELLNAKQAEFKALKVGKAQEDKESLQKRQAVEKEIIALNYTISDLERQLQEGTKNQVVSKLESLRQQRQAKPKGDAS